MNNERISSDSPPNYTGGRELTLHTVKSNDGTSILTVGSTGFIPSKAVLDILQPGVDFELETQGFSKITGVKVEGDWIERKTDDDLKREHEEMIASFRKKNIERLEERRADWTRRESELPQWLRDRLDYFRDRGGENFEIEGWGYELIICEIAVLMEATMPSLTGDDDDSKEVSDYCSEQGVSGNQYGFAKALVRAHRQDPERSMRETVSAMSPITGDAFYTRDKDVV